MNKPKEFVLLGGYVFFVDVDDGLEPTEIVLSQGTRIVGKLANVGIPYRCPRCKRDIGLVVENGLRVERMTLECGRLHCECGFVIKWAKASK